VMRLLEKAPSERHANASEVLERLQRELRVLTREDPAAVIRSVLVTTGFASAEREAAGRALSARRPMSIARVALGHGLVLLAFVIGVLAIESGAARGADDASGRPLELQPENGGGLRVVASPWAYVRVDGQQVETTPFARAIPLAPGKHWVTLTHPDAPAIEREITVTPNDTVMLDVTMVLGGALEDAGKNPR